MDPVKFKVVRGSLDTALDQDLGEEHAARRQHDRAEFSRRDFNKQIESILKKALRATSAGTRAGRAEKVNDIRGEVVRFIVHDLFLPGSEGSGTQGEDRLPGDGCRWPQNMNARMEVRWHRP